MAISMRNDSPGPLPPGVGGWNWGAFFLNWIWGIGNNTFIALLALVPFVNFVMIFVLGAKGSEWAWRNGQWQSVEHFKRVQRRWAIAGLITWLALGGLFALGMMSMVSAIKGSDIYRQTVTQVASSEEAVRWLGAPVAGGFPMGSFSISGGSGEAQFAMPVSGPKGKGTVYVEATLEMGAWRFERIELEIDGRERRIDLNSGRELLPRTPSEKQA
jgi:hypothetical protein